MPYFQIDVPQHYSVEVKRDLARRLGDQYARIMQTTPDMVRVAFRELGEGGVWHCGAGEPEPAACISCDIRRGRSPEQRLKFAQALVDACKETLDLRTDIIVEFTQHPGDESFGAGGWGWGWAPDWTPAESTKQSGK
jgi:phenylpyruvate tautomerase PptA (4-oxalocrotonate tautomerase family)